jgi:hypothetical protein
VASPLRLPDRARRLRTHPPLDGNPRCVALAYDPDDVQEIEQVLGCVVRARAPWTGLEMSRESGSMPFRRSDPVLRRLLEQQANEIISRIPIPDGVAIDAPSTSQADRGRRHTN